MSKFTESKPYESSKIPVRGQPLPQGGSQPLPPAETDSAVSFDDGLFYVIDYDASNIEGVGKFVSKPQKIDAPVKDDIRDLFYSMREIGRANRTSYFGNNRFFDKRVQREKALALYKQGMFMKDFTDDYPEQTGFKEYFPYYQLMSYEQLRTYFTWRTGVRGGTITETSLSYVFLYMYELLNNIGVASPQDGLQKLMAFWAAYRGYDGTIDKYVLRWLKDYHIYYPLPHSFRAFIETNNLLEHYPGVVDANESFNLYCSISKYDIRKSAFYAENRVSLVTGCFSFVIKKLRQMFDEAGIPFNDCVFQPAKKMLPWSPFKDALFHPWLKQPDRRVVLSERELYVCSRNNWTFHTVITMESGKQLVGYILKQIEAVLRAATHYKYKLTANINTVTPEMMKRLEKHGLPLEKIVSGLTLAFYREATKTVVTVDPSSLSKIRLEALATQEKLIVEEPDAPPAGVQNSPLAAPAPLGLEEKASATEDTSASSSGSWESLKSALSETEMNALRVVLQGKRDIKTFADGSSIMLEVLVDGINEKAADCIGDNLLDDDFMLYDDYIDQVKKMVG